MPPYRSKKEQRKIAEAKLHLAKQYAYMRYFRMIEKFLKQSKIQTYGFEIVSLTESKDLATLVIGTMQYKNNEKILVPYYVDIKTKTENGKKKHYLKLEELEQKYYVTQIDIYDLYVPDKAEQGEEQENEE